jgi:hypothetical protein
MARTPTHPPMSSTLRDAPLYATLASPEFDAAADAAVQRMLARQAAFDTEWFPDGFRSWSCDQGEGVIRFFKRDGTGIQARVQILGSYAPDSETWEWAWNNPHVNEELSRDARVVRANGETNGHAVLTTGIVRASAEESRRLIGMAAAIVNAPAVHWGDAGDHAVAMTYWDARRISLKDVRPPETAKATQNTSDATDDDESSQGLLSLLLSWLFSAILGLLFGSYYRHAAVLKRSRAKRHGAGFLPLTTEQEARIAPYLLEDLTEIEQTLAERGFSSRFRVGMALTDETTRIATLFENPSDGTLGFVIVNATQHSGVSRTTTFETHFADGITLYTSNSANILRTPPRATARSISFAGITDVARIHDIHRFRVQERSVTVATTPRTRAPDPIAYTDAETLEVHDHWIARGYYRRTADGMLAMTWRGAFLSAWRGLFPWKQISESRNARQAAAVLQSMRLRNL